MDKLEELLKDFPKKEAQILRDFKELQSKVTMGLLGVGDYPEEIGAKMQAQGRDMVRLGTQYVQMGKILAEAK